jgi:hypothetical protein
VEDCIIRSFITYIAKCYKGDQGNEDEMGVVCSRNERYEKCIQISVRKHETKRVLGRTTRRWEDNIRIDFREIGWEGVDLTRPSYDRDQWRALVNTTLNFRFS